MENKISKRNVLITGASSGIGLELAAVFAENGFNLILVARREEKLRAAAERFQSAYGIEVTLLVKDLFRSEAVQEMAEELRAWNISVDILVNNAGLGALGPFYKMDPEKIVEMIQVNVTALTRLTRQFLPDMLERGYGKILNVSSTAAFQPGPLMAVYYATKAFVLNFSEAISHELKGTPVTVTALCPGPTASEFQKKAGMKNALVGRVGLMSSQRVAEIGYRGLMKGKRVVIPGFPNRLGAWFAKHAPRPWVMTFIRWIQENRDSAE
ncbi:MAG: SDR family oxidoreductase [Calditrichaeota bacterium]|nr:SDR family oxidoreductase [Calditrichota bacterium]